MASQFTQGGQEVWSHDPGYWGGIFHTYNQFHVGGEQDNPRCVHVFLPRDYELNDDHYPVIYMNDGDRVFFADDTGKNWEIPQLLTRLYLSNQIRKVIVVAVCPLNRDYEYTHARVWDKDWGGLEDYAHYLAFDLKSFIDTHYRTLPESEDNLIVGASHGGLAAFFTATQYPEKFRSVAALSPSFWVGLDSSGEMSWLSSTEDSFFDSLATSTLLFYATPTLQDPRQQLKIYLDWGLVRDGQFHNDFMEARAAVRGRQMQELLIGKFGYREGKNLFVVEDPMGQHTEASWSGRMENVLRIFFGF